jgi:hypothetical protein
MFANNLMNQQYRFVDVESPNVKNADVWTERFLYSSKKMYRMALFYSLPNSVILVTLAVPQMSFR